MAQRIVTYIRIRLWIEMNFLFLVLCWIILFRSCVRCFICLHDARISLVYLSNLFQAMALVCEIHLFHFPYDYYGTTRSGYTTVTVRHSAWNSLPSEQNIFACVILAMATQLKYFFSFTYDWINAHADVAAVIIESWRTQAKKGKHLHFIYRATNKWKLEIYVSPSERRKKNKN